MNRRERRKAEREASKRARRVLNEARKGGAAHSITEGDVPEWIVRAVKEAERRARPGRLPLTAIRPSGGTKDDALVVMRFATFLRFLEDAGGEVSAEEGGHE